MKKHDFDALEKKLVAYEGEDKIVSSLELAETIKNTTTVETYKMGVPSLDRILNGVEPGELIVVTGPTGHGKTTLLMSITQNMASDEAKKVNSAWFTLEVTPKQFLKKISTTGSIPLFYLPSKNTENHVDWLIERIIEAYVKHDTRIIFVDHLHQIFSIERFEGNLSLELGDVVGKLKQVALEFGLVIFLVAHCTDNKESDTEPKMKDIRDSGMISRLADVVMGVWKIKNDNDGTKKRLEEVDEHDNRSKVRIWKNRREGTVGWFLMQHNNHRLVELSQNDYGTDTDRAFNRI